MFTRLLLLAVLGAGLAPADAGAALICTTRDEAATLLSAEILREAVMARGPVDSQDALEIFRLGTLRCSEHLGVVQALAQDASGLRTDLGRQVSIAAWLHLQGLRPDSHLNPGYQARVIHLVARRSPLDLEALAAQVVAFEHRYGPGSGWEEALAADEALLVNHWAIRREVLQVAASAAHTRARETDDAEDWDQVLTWTLRLGGDGSDPEATRAWALAAWESGDRLKAETVLREQAEKFPVEAPAALGMLANLHWTTRVVVRGTLAAPPEAQIPEEVLVLEGGHLRPRYPLAVADRAMLRAIDDFLALGPSVDAKVAPAPLALAAAVLTLTHGQLPETRSRLVALVETWPETTEAAQAVRTLTEIGSTYAHAPRRDRPADLCLDHAVATAWADGASADVDANTLGAVAAWRAPRCR